MFRFFKKSRLLIAALMLSAACGSVAPNTAVAGGNMGGYCGTGQTAHVYVVNLYYAKDGRWNYYGRYFATKYSGGAVDWGGAEYAVRQIQGAGLQYTYTSSFWRTTNNG